MAKIYEVRLYKTFDTTIYVEAETKDEANIIGYALADNDYDKTNWEPYDDETRIEFFAIDTLDTKEDIEPEQHVYKKEDFESYELEDAVKSIQAFNAWWDREREIWKKKGVEEYLEKQNKK